MRVSGSEIDTLQALVTGKGVSWSVAIEWGFFYSLTAIMIDYFVVGLLSDRGLTLLYYCGIVIPLLVFLVVAKEARDKTLRGNISFWKAFSLAILAGIVIYMVKLFWIFVIYAPHMFVSKLEIAQALLASHGSLFVLYAFMVGMIMRRKRGRA